MKTTGWRSLILYIIGAGFLVGIIFFICSYFIQGGSWAIRPSNAHITNNGQLTYSGEITDRDSNLLSYSKDGVQQYNDNALIRKATLHVVGDPNGYISTGAQYAFRTQLSGFNPITGVVLYDIYHQCVKHDRGKSRKRQAEKLLHTAGSIHRRDRKSVV